MSDKSGVASQAISLPKGGGALHGIGETFAPDLHTGTGNFTVPIAVPSGRNGFQPQLSLSYSTGNGNGPFGLGWSVSVPGISRKTSKGVPRYDDASDTFILSGAEDLVPVGTDSDTSRYRPRTEGLFARIEHHRRPDADCWEVRTKDGLVSFYGARTTGSPVAPPLPDEGGTIRDPASSRRIFAWNLTETRDPFDNRIWYEYARDVPASRRQREQDEANGHLWSRRLLTGVRYADYDDGGTTRFLVSVTFEYEDRPDPFSEYRAGFEIRTSRRCTRIVVRTHPERGDARAREEGVLVRSYELIYLDQRADDVPASVLPHNGVSLLSRVVVVGHDEDQAEPQRRLERLPSLELAYSRFEPERRRYRPFMAAGNSVPDRSLGHPDHELVDLFGNGLPCVLQLDGTARYWRNLGDGRFGRPRALHAVPAEARLADPGVQIADMDGDGRADLLVTDGVRGGYYPVSFDGGWDPDGFVPYGQAPTVSLDDPDVRLVDLDGDGVIDALRTGPSFELYYNDPETGWAHGERRPRRGLPDFPDVTFTDPRVKLADMTGDGLQDIVLVHHGRVEYWPSLGYGRWGSRITMRNSPRFEDAAVYGATGYDPKRVLLGDVDGDGAADLVYVGSGHVTVWLNQGGNGWSQPITVHGTPPITDMDAVRLADMHGTGTAGILWTYDHGTQRESTYKFLDLTGGVKPYLLSRVDNHMGAVTRVDYAPSTRFYLEDERRPETRWKTTLPFPVQVVARVETIDAISRGKLTTEYRYRHGYWDGEEREFRGFGFVEQRDTETFDAHDAPGLHGRAADFARVPRAQFSPPTLTKTWFHLGPVSDRSGDWTEVDLGAEFWAPDPQTFTRPPAMTRWLGTLAPRSRRDALRTLRGRILRIELYAQDGSARQGRPYTVTEHLHAVAPLPVGEAPSDAPTAWQTRVFFPHTLAERTTQWERGDDPLTMVSFTDDYDAHGQPRQQTVVALPRRSAKRRPVRGAVVGEVPVDETRILATHTRTVYALPTERGLELHDRVAHVFTFELADPPSVTEQAPADLGTVLAAQRAAAHAVHEQFREAFGSWAEGQPLPTGAHLTGHTRNYYDGPAFIGRDDGKVGPYGVLTRAQTLVCTDLNLDEAYGERRPAYLGGRAALPDGAPTDSGSRLGYRLEAAPHDGGQACYYVDTQRRQFDFQNGRFMGNAATRRGLVTATQDPLRHQSTIEPDSYWLLPRRVIDAAGLETSAVYDYRVLQPTLVTEANGNVTHFRYTPLGLLHRQFVRSRDGSRGGAEAKPEAEFRHDFLAYDRTRDQQTPQPVFVHTIRRVRHASDDVSDETIESREYSDGFGRLIQTRAQAQDLAFGTTGDDVGLPPDPGVRPRSATGEFVLGRVTVSGWQVYDNKGRVVETYEPFFGAGWHYQPEAEARKGQHATHFYDPRGRVLRTVNPDGSEERGVFGVPGSIARPDLTDLDVFEPTPWESAAYDANDLAPLSRHPVERLPDGSPKTLGDRAPALHHFTPGSQVIDALGRVICQVARNGPDPAADWFLTRSTYDLRGNLLVATDALGRAAFRHTYDLLNRPLRVESIDAGLRTRVLDAAGNLVEYRDAKGSVVLRRYDELNRLTHVWARDVAESPVAVAPAVTLRERLVYGDAGDAAAREAALQANLLGRLHRHWDEAGLQRFDRYDFTGSLEEKSRQVISDAAIAAGWTVNWDEPGSESIIDATRYETSTRYDALGRPLEVRYPRDVTDQRAVLTPRYNRAGALEAVALDGEPYVRQIAYNAKGQRVLIAYGNDLMTRYAYDARTFRLTRLRSGRYRETRLRVNVALAANGATATASSTYDGEFPPSAVNNGDRRGARFPHHWNDNTRDTFPDWVEVRFAGRKTIDQIDVFTTQDAPLEGRGAPVEPTPDLTFAKYGITDFAVEYWDGTGWSPVPDGKVTNNRNVWRSFTFPAITTERVRVCIYGALGRYSRVVEVEAHERGTGTNVALASEGGVARASSTLQGWPPSMAIDGDRVVYHWKGQWPNFAYPGWLQVDLGGPKTLDEIDLYFHQDTSRPFVEPTEDLISKLALTDFEVQYRSGADWTTVPGGSVAGNDRVRRSFRFPPITTDGIRVVIPSGNREITPAIQEIEAYGPPAVQLTGEGAPLQDFTYGYDLSGNITTIDERTPNCSVVGSRHGRHRLVREFRYDPLYRLTRADGRACRTIGASRPTADLPRCGAFAGPYAGGSPTPTQDNAPELTEHYVEGYEYDPAGNMLALRYSAASGNWTRAFGMGGLPPEQWQAAPDNRLTSLAHDGLTEQFIYDTNGNLRVQNTERRYTWDHADRLIGFTIQPAGSAQASVKARYLYGADGIRVKKWVRTGGTGDGASTVYVDGVFEYHSDPAVGVINNHLHVMDGSQRIALVRRGPALPQDGGPVVQFHLGDHLGSSSIVVDERGAWVNREEYFPYGETSFGSFGRKRYRFAGKERDEESGLAYHQARFYASGVARWVSCDPAGAVDGLNTYAFVHDNPTKGVDLNGMQTDEPSIAHGSGEGPLYREKGSLETGTYEKVHGHHIDQSAAHIDNSGKDPLRKQAISISQKTGAFAQPAGQPNSVPHQRTMQVQDAVNRGLLGELVDVTLKADPVNRFPKVTITATGNGVVTPVPSATGDGVVMGVPNRWAESSKAQFALLAAGVHPEEAGDLASQSADQRLAANSLPTRIPGDRTGSVQVVGPSFLERIAKQAVHLPEGLSELSTTAGKSVGNMAVEVASTAGRLLRSTGRALSLLGPVGDIFDAVEFHGHLKNGTKPGVMNLWIEVDQWSTGLEYPDGTPVRDIKGNDTGYIIIGGRVSIGG